MAYTKYSLTPANNTAAPPDGAPEGMLPSAVNDTMRDMMAQIRDCGDGVRDGTYTMTAPKITGGTITGVTLTGNTLTNPVITGATLTTSAFNGTVGATTASTGAFTTLSTSSTTTFSGLTASTALALDASKNVVSVTNTGTGNNVLSASPTLTGTIAGASLSLSSLTSGRVTYAGASGLLSDSANLTFSGTQLNVTGLISTSVSATTLTNALNINTASAGFGSVITYQNGGVTKYTAGLNVFTGTGEWGIYDNAAALIRLYLSSTGNVGIGTSSPSSPLTVSTTGVNSTVQINSTDGAGGYGAVLSLNNTGTGGREYYISSTSNADGGVGGGKLKFYDNAASATRMLIDSAGLVGIGTSSPSMKLDVTSGATTSTAIFTSTATTAYSPTTSASVTNARLTLFGGSATNSYNAIRFTNSGSFENFFGAVQSSAGTGQFVWGGYNGSAYGEWMRLDSSGNLGLGVTPSAWGSGYVAAQVGSASIFSQAGGSGGYFIGNGYFNGSAYIYKNTAAATRYEMVSGQHAWSYAASGIAGNAITFTQAMTLDSSGNLLVGTTSQFASGALCVVDTPGKNAISTQSSNGNNLYTGVNSSFTAIFVVASNGNVTNANNSYGSTSDIKLKENIVDATPKLEKINQVRVVNYNLIGDTQKQIGVVAQELEQIFPSMVETSTDKDNDGNDLGTTTKSVKYSVFVPMLIKAIQEQQALIESLTTRLTALENK